MKIECTACLHHFDSPISDPGEIEYQKCQNLFKMQYKMKVPCPNCKAILRLQAGPNSSFIGVPSQTDPSSSMDATFHSLENHETQASQTNDEATSHTAPRMIDKHKPQTQITQTTGPRESLRFRINSASSSPIKSDDSPTAVKPFKIMPQDQKARQPFRLSDSKLPKKKSNKKFNWFNIFATGLTVLCLASLSAFLFSMLDKPAPLLVSQSEDLSGLDSLEYIEPSVPDEMEGSMDGSDNAGTSMNSAQGGVTEDVIRDEDSPSFSDVSSQLAPYQSSILALPDLKNLTSHYGIRLDPFTHRLAFHGGVDFRGRIGDPIVAALDGTVAFSGRRGRYGLMVTIKHGSGFETRYAHLSRSQVKKGQKVKKGEPIAGLGNSGRSTGPHLHFELLKDGRKVNPLTVKLRNNNNEKVN